MRNFGITTVQAGLGGNEHRPARYDADTRADSNIILFPSGSILSDTAGPALERSDPLQTFFDCLFVVSAALLVTATGVGITFAVYVLLFVRL